jgi:Zn-dependent protease
MPWVAAAGPVTNLIVAFVGLVGFALARQAGLPGLLAEPIGGMLLWTFQFNLALGIFNLIPLPPLDGGHFLPYVLPRPAAAALRQLEQWGPMLLLLLVVSGGTRWIVGPVFERLASLYVAVVRSLL